VRLITTLEYIITPNSDIASSLEKAFDSHKAIIDEQAQPLIQEQSPASRVYDDDLARTAGQILETVSEEQNPKFKNSQFMNLMRQLRDHDAVVEGNDMIFKSESAFGVERIDVKGKGKAVDFALPPTTVPHHGAEPLMMEQKWVGQQPSVVDPNEAYFNEENAGYARYWNAHHARPEQEQHEHPDWGRLQSDWDAFEATTTGVRPVGLHGYQFQTGNPYLQRDRSVAQTHHHAFHDQRPQSFFEVHLCLCAIVMWIYPPYRVCSSLKLLCNTIHKMRGHGSS
jgi:peroxin-5